jgi:chromate transport protein ChrA
MKTITIDITNCLYYSLPPLIMFIIIMWCFMKYEYDSYCDNFIDIFTYLVLSLCMTAIFSLIYFNILHLILDYHYTFTL